jgi:L-fuconolactonase
VTPRIDAHHHLWDPATADYPWLTDDLAVIKRAFTPDDLRAEVTAAGFDATVLVQTRSSEDETVEFLRVAMASDVVAGVVGWVDLTRPDVGDRIGELGDVGGGHLVGIRHQVHDEADPAWLERPDVREGLEAVATAGLAYDLLVRTRELPSAVAVARALPELRFVLDHAAKPPIAGGELGAWEAALRPLAACENVVCKLSGLVTEASWEAWLVADLRPAADVVLEAFGPDRVLFGSDWPVSLLAAPYAGVVRAAEELTAALSPSERAAVFGGTAIDVYDLKELL